MTTFSDNSSVDEQIINVYTQALKLFPRHTKLDLRNAYHRGVVEMVLGLLGMDQGDAEEVADIISEGTHPTKDQLDQVINKHFPNRLLTFYLPDDNYDVAAVENCDGSMWRVWADGDTQKYKV